MTSRRAPGPWDQRFTITAEIIDAVAPVRSLLPDSRILYLQFQLPKSSDNQNIFFVGGGGGNFGPVSYGGKSTNRSDLHSLFIFLGVNFHTFCCKYINVSDGKEATLALGVLHNKWHSPRMRC